MVQRMAQVLVDEAVAGAITDSAQEHVDVIAQAAQAEHEFQENNRFVGKVNVAMTHLVKDEAVAKYVDEHFYDAPWDFDFFKKMDKIMQVEYKSTPMEVLACRKARRATTSTFSLLIRVCCSSWMWAVSARSARRGSRRWRP